MGEHLINFIENREVTGKTTPLKGQDFYYTQLKNENRRIRGNLQFFTENRRIRQIYETTKDKDISYRDINDKGMQRRIKSVHDLYRIIFDTFKIS